MATTAAEAGIENVAIKSLGQWQSSAHKQYIRLSQSALASMDTHMLQSSIVT